jgi:hypothetical protein
MGGGGQVSREEEQEDFADGFAESIEDDRLNQGVVRGGVDEAEFFAGFRDDGGDRAGSDLEVEEGGKEEHGIRPILRRALSQPIRDFFISPTLALLRGCGHHMAKLTPRMMIV